MSFLYYEGTKDYLAATPALIVTFRASGSITAGRGVVFETNDNSTDVYQPAGCISGSLDVAGVALGTVSDNDPVPVLIWGYAKALPKLPTTTAYVPNQPLVLTGAGQWCASGSYDDVGSNAIAGKIVSGSGTYIVAFINCIK